MNKILFILAFLLSAVSFGQNDALFEQGKGLYKAEKYQEAITTWMKILNNKVHSSEVYFNLGNAHYKMSNVGPSIYYYEKALQLSPNDSEIKNNLAFAQNATVDAIEALPKTIFSKWYTTIAEILHFESWAVVSIVISLSAIVLFLLYHFSYSESKKRLFFVSSLCLFFVLIISITMSYTTYNEAMKKNPAIVFSESTEVKSEPNLGSEAVFTLHEGTKVQIIIKEDDWARIRLVDGKDGWIPLSDLKEL
ncbi:MAG: tetratricopeptide (TPR) repeat protein [Flavobacteriaceae bacterium]|jgi:tetratricopeptide (TPR) repeat protein|uniref:tetratricopeptide repeat protein n=1 Tax=Candidatus Marifrigoribacter sp. Uisw_064 TaxID=3230970 RepID=UPI003AEE88E9